MKLLRYLFGLQDEVTRKGYLIAGFSLAILKFAIDFALVYFTTGKYWRTSRRSWCCATRRSILHRSICSG